MPRRRDPNEFTPLTKRVLADRVNYLCSVCGRPTSGPRRGHDKAVSIGVAAQIKAASPEGARYDPRMTPAQRRDPRNGIWACQNHGKLIDNDPSRYTVTRLRQLKRDAEIEALHALEDLLAVLQKQADLDSYLAASGSRRRKSSVGVGVYPTTNARPAINPGGRLVLHHRGSSCTAPDI